MLFSTKREHDPFSLAKKKNSNKEEDSKNTNLPYEKRLLAKYKDNTLSKEELQQNLYPSSELPIYEEYINTKNIPAKTEASIKDLIIAMDCEMVTIMIKLLNN
jgi:hypothetical protein